MCLLVVTQQFTGLSFQAFIYFKFVWLINLYDSFAQTWWISIVTANLKNVPSLTLYTNLRQALIGSSLPIMAIVGDDVILPCFLQPPRNAAALTFEWTRPDLQPRFVFVWRQNEIRDIKNPQFVNRAFLFQDELKHGNISLKLTNVKPKDSGVYRCFIPALEKETSIKLTVGSSSPVVVSVAVVDVWGPRVVLHCASGGWSPEPELWWLDSEGRLLSVERSVSVSDGVYEVSSRVTVKQSGTFNCTVTQIDKEQELHVFVLNNE
uniref:Ig-like domain-containing protein n=1 Tax=Periophthalmus magnuspinnatus TaxID=409849 RepID=A0A3B4ATA1_9GOBI